MKIKNTTDWEDRFLRKMVSWCCREIGLPVAKLKLAKFSNTKKRRWTQHGSAVNMATGLPLPFTKEMVDQPAYAGWGGYGKISVRIGDECKFPTKEFERFGSTHCEFADRIEALVGVTAHEVYHCWQTANQGMAGRSRIDEPRAMSAERRALDKFRANRAELLAKWEASGTIKLVVVDASPEDRKIEKAMADLARWQRKLKLAQTKCRKLKNRVNYYERRAACRSQETVSC